MKVTRVVEYEGTEEDLKIHLERTLLSAQIVICPGDDVPGIGKLHAAFTAPKITIRLLSETWE